MRLRAAGRSGRPAASAPARDRRAGRSRRSTPSSSTRFSVSASANAQDGAVDAGGRGGVEAGRDVGRPHEGAGGVVDGDEVRAAAPASASSPFRTDCCRLAPPGTGGGRSKPRGRRLDSGARRPARSRPGSGRCRAWPEGRERVPQDRLAAQKRILLGQRAAEAAAAAGGDDQGGTSGHGRLDNTGYRGCALRTLAAAGWTRLLLAQLLCTAQDAY